VLSNASSIVRPGDAVFGPDNPPVTFLEFFEPNCPHCISFHPVAKRLMAQYDDRVRFVFKPVVSAQNSVYQAQALYAAQGEGRFLDMLDAQFASGHPENMTGQQIAQVADEIGMDGQALVRRIDQGVYRSQMMANRADFIQTGWASVPAVAIDGRLVGSRTPECLAHLLDEALES
jgi:protein-disulfide isomerase